MQLPQIVVRPEKRYRRDGSRKLGAQRTDNLRSRTLALFDHWSISKRPREVRCSLSDQGMAELKALADELRVCPSGLAAYLVESALRGKS